MGFSLVRKIVLEPETNQPLTRLAMYTRMVAIGRKAEVLDPHPRRYRDSFTPLLCFRALPRRCDVAKVLGDSMDAVETHYAPFVRELRERARRIMESGEGLEITGTQQKASKGRIQ